LNESTSTAPQTKAAPDRDLAMMFVLAVGVLTVGNAVWMLVGPMHWYTDLPAAVPDTGPFNPHFVRDIGCAFLATGIALIWAYRRPDYRVPLVSIAAVFLAAHAILHAYDTLRGALGHDHWLLDLPGVYLPGLALPVIAIRLASREAGQEQLAISHD
jgi:hypothetical protein